MKIKSITLLITAVLAAVGMTNGAEFTRPYIGIDIDSSPLPALLVKHLKLTEGEGLRIDNVVVGSPGDKAQIERDDILVSLNGEAITEYQQVVDTVRNSNVGRKLSLGIIHLGEKRTVELALEAVDVLNYEWRYPQVSDVVEQWSPGRIFQMQPGDKNWIEIPLENIMPNNFSIDSSQFFSQLGTFRYSEKSPDYEITVELNPSKDKATITIKTSDTEYKVTEDDIEKLPEQYRGLATKALKNAKEQRGPNALDITLSPEVTSPSIEIMPQSIQRSVPGLEVDRLERIEQRLIDIQSRLDELEKQNSEKQEQRRGEAEESTNRNIPSQQSTINSIQKT